MAICDIYSSHFAGAHWILDVKFTFIHNLGCYSRNSHHQDPLDFQMRLLLVSGRQGDLAQHKSLGGDIKAMLEMIQFDFSYI